MPSLLKRTAAVAFAAVAFTALSGCSKIDSELKESATKTLDNSGYSEITLKTENFGEALSAAASCANSDITGIGFSAKNPIGKKVDGVVCIGGGFKGNTVRF
ncbi:MAG: hypothetical protein PW788_06420 [Micavibrio sp.]|nr:hypothetical protein [Micavibrio sp.]